MAEGKGGARRWIASLVDFGWPLGLIIGYVITRDMVMASWGLVAGAAIALVVGYVLERRIAPMPLAAGVLALVFGLLTLVFKDPPLRLHQADGDLPGLRAPAARWAGHPTQSPEDAAGLQPAHAG